MTNSISNSTLSASYYQPTNTQSQDNNVQADTAAEKSTELQRTQEVAQQQNQQQNQQQESVAAITGLGGNLDIQA